MSMENENIKNVSEFIEECKAYLKSQKEYTKLELTEKLTIIFSAMILIILLCMLGIVVLFYLSITLALFLESYVGGLIASFSIITAGLLLVMVLVYTFRKRIIVEPLVNFFANIFYPDKGNNSDGNKDDR